MHCHSLAGRKLVGFGMATLDASPKLPRSPLIHPLVVRITHWLNAFAIFCMVASGWRIYNASPIFSFRFPDWLTLGGWLGGALLWHFAAMWLLMLNAFVYLAYGISSGHFRHTLLPISPREIWSDFNAALRFRLVHMLGRYNSVQRAMYVGVIALIILLILSGFAIWKPVQLHWLAALMGDYEGARLVHFFAMSGIVLFIIVHLLLVAIVPRTLKPMITGRAGSAHGNTHHG
jgi:thiosulfate reductase cytochrome b subunit